MVLGLRLRYIDVRPSSADGLPLLLIHGHASRIEEYTALIPHLGARRILAVDLPGCGYSEKPDRPYDFRFWEDSLLAFLDVMQIRQPIDLAGGSLGGNLVLRLADREGSRFSRLAAWAPGGSWERKRWTAWGARVMKRLPFAFWPTLWVQSRFWFRRDWPGRSEALGDAWTYFREVFEPSFHRMYWEMAAAQVEDSLFARAARIMHPTYLAYGELDSGLGMNVGVPRLASLLPNAILRKFKGARHALASEVSAELGTDIDAFLSARPRTVAVRPTRALAAQTAIAASAQIARRAR